MFSRSPPAPGRFVLVSAGGIYHFMSREEQTEKEFASVTQQYTISFAIYHSKIPNISQLVAREKQVKL